MKFAKQLEYNTYRAWKQYYIAYPELKILISGIVAYKPREDDDNSSDDQQGDGMAAEPLVFQKGETEVKGVTADMRKRRSMRRTLSAAALAKMGLGRSASASVLKGLEQGSTQEEAVENEEKSDAAAERTHLLAGREEGKYGSVKDQTGVMFESSSGASTPRSSRSSRRPRTLRRPPIPKRRSVLFEEKQQLFFERLNLEAEKVDAFYCRMFNELKTRTDLLYRYARLAKRMYIAVRSHTPLEPEDLDAEDLPFYRAVRGYDSPVMWEVISALRDKYQEIYVEVDELANFTELNGTGFDKILKKHDKKTLSTTRAAFMEKLTASRNFMSTTEVEELRAKLSSDFASLFCDNDERVAREKLNALTRELVVWERNTIWREMLRDERKVEAIRPRGKGSIVDAINVYSVAVALLAFVTLIWFPQIVTFLAKSDSRYSGATLAAAHRCLAMLVAVCILWATGGVELFVTSLMIIPASVLLHCFVDALGEPLSAPEAAHEVFSAMGSPTLMLIISVYSIHAALSKYEIDKVVATKILARVRQPDAVLLVLMLLAVLLSMFVSNVATPVLLNSVVVPVFHGLPPSSRPLIKCILLGIAIASNIGGMASAIASPQNAVAVGQLAVLHEVGFVEWLVAATPQCLVILLIAHRLLLLMFKPGTYQLPTVKEHITHFKWQHYTVMFSVLLTVVLWSLPASSDIFGSPGLVAAVPVIIFFGSGLLVKEDFDNLPWHVIYLVAGGIALGAAVGSSELLHLIARWILSYLKNAGVWMTYAVFVVFVSIVASAVSHTVSAIIILPIVAEVGASLGHPRLLVVGCALACSGAMSLPVSSFPNISAVSIQDELGNPYLATSDLVRVGIIMTFVSLMVILFVGYVLMGSMGF